MRRSTRLSNKQTPEPPIKVEVRKPRRSKKNEPKSPEPEYDEEEESDVPEEEFEMDDDDADLDDDDNYVSDDSVTEQLKRKRTKNRTSMSAGVAPSKHSRLEESTRRFRFRQSAVTNSKTKVFKIYEYIHAVGKGYRKFCQTLAGEGIIDVLINCKSNKWVSEKADKENLEKWLNRKSVRIDTVAEANDNNSIKIFESKIFDYELKDKKHDLSSLNVDSILRNEASIKDEVASTLKKFEKDKKYRKKSAQSLYCGGPILSIKACPQNTSDRLEVVAIVTLADEITWKHDLSIPSYVQFWKYDGNKLSEPAFLWYLLKIENIGFIADITWCPLFTEEILKKPSMKKKVDQNLLGHLAVTTDCGKILIFRIDKDMPSSDSEVPIFSTKPCLELCQPLLTVKDSPEDKVIEEKYSNINDTMVDGDTTMDVEKSKKSSPKKPPVPKKRKSRPKKTDEDDAVDAEANESGVEDFVDYNYIDREIDGAPFIYVYWAPYDSGKHIVGVSATGWIVLWDLSSENPSDASDWLYDNSWESPPTSAALIGDNILVVAFSNCKLLYYEMDTKNKIFEDSSARSIGSAIHVEQMTFPGTFTYDIIKVIPEPDGQQYYCSAYQVVDLTNDAGLTMQPLNKHVGQCLHLSVCPLSGIVGTVGIDGRLDQSLTGRLAPRGSTQDYACSNHRPAMQLIRRTKENVQSFKDIIEAVDGEEGKKEKKFADKPLIEHDDIVNNCWLELRLGDDVLIDQVSSAQSSTFVEKATFSRRLEMLMRVDFSRHTPGLSITGGEAGLVFIVPTSL